MSWKSFYFSGTEQACPGRSLHHERLAAVGFMEAEVTSHVCNNATVAFSHVALWAEPFGRGGACPAKLGLHVGPGVVVALGANKVWRLGEKGPVH